MTCPRRAAAKAGLRTQLLQARAALTAEVRASASLAVCRRVAALPELRGARAVLGYAAFGAEVDLDPFLRELLLREVGVFLPVVDGEDLLIARITDLEADVAPGWNRVREPRSPRAARPDRLDAAVVPGVGFDPAGGRLGYGGGHFDRLLARLRPETPVIGVAHDVQVVPAVPVDAHDRRVTVVVTPTRVLRPVAPDRRGRM